MVYKTCVSLNNIKRALGAFVDPGAFVALGAFVDPGAFVDFVRERSIPSGSRLHTTSSGVAHRGLPFHLQPLSLIHRQIALGMNGFISYRLYRLRLSPSSTSTTWLPPSNALSFGLHPLLCCRQIASCSHRCHEPKSQARSSPIVEFRHDWETILWPSAPIQSRLD